MNKVNTLKLSDPLYPAALKNINQPPDQLYWLGTPINNWLASPKLAVVGSRKISQYGREVTSSLANQLAASGVVIISGLAYGVDATAHQAALAANGRTVAVLPTAVDKIYPASHANLAKQIIAAGGTLISEYAATDAVYKANFTLRNRIISGLADAVVITEAAALSGSLNTARYALEQGRTVLAVPGNINSSNSEGANQLIKAGALPVTSADDILFALGLSPGKQASKPPYRGSAHEVAALKLMEAGVSDQEDLARQLQLDGAATASLLIGLEVAGQIKPAGGGQWIKT